MKKRIIAWMLVLTSLFSLSVYAEPIVTTTANATSTNTSDTKPKDGITLTMDEAIQKGLANSILMEKVKKQAELASLISENAKKNENDIKDATQKLEDATRDINRGRSFVYSSMSQLDSAQALFDQGIAPSPIPIKKPGTEQIVMTIPAGKNIADFLNAIGKGEYIALIKAEVQKELDKQRQQLNDGLAQFDSKTQEYESGKNKYDLSMQFAMIGVANKLSTSTISSLEPKPLAELIVKMADIQDKTTSYSQDIYKNQIALLIQNSYYEVLKQEKLLVVKDKAMERAKLQNEYAEYAYKVGAKSKDDKAFAKLYYDSTVIAKEMQLKEYNNAMIELKKNLNMPLDAKLYLVPVEGVVKADDVAKKDDATKVDNATKNGATTTKTSGVTKADEIIKVEPIVKTEFDLVKGIESGLKTRLEMKMAEAKVQLYKELKDTVERSSYKDSDNQYKEAKLLCEQSDIELRDTKLKVESEIRKSYETVMTMEKVAETAKNLEESAAETVEIAKLKYEVGFGASNALMKQLNLDDLSGTMAEVIAAEENLANVQEKAIEAVNGYNLAKAKYLNDIGILPYK